MTKNRIRVLNSAWLKWTAPAVLAFLLAGLVTKQLVSANRSVEGEDVQQAMAASLRKLDSGDPAGARDDLARAGRTAPNNMGVQAALIGRFQALGEYRLAAEAIERLLRATPREQQTARSYAGLCEYLLKHGDIDDAQRVLAGDLMARWPDALETTYLQGAVALQSARDKDDLAAATRRLRECVASAPDHVPSQVQLGIAHERLGELEQAEPLLRGALEQTPFDPVVLFHLADVLRRQGKTSEAAKFEAEHKRVSALQERREQLKAQGMLKQLQPADLLELGRIHTQLQEFGKAASTLRAYTRRQPADADALRELTQACLRSDDPEGARHATGLADALVAGRKP